MIGRENHERVLVKAKVGKRPHNATDIVID